MRKQLITKIAATMLQFTDDRFREQGWLDETLQPWEKRKNDKDSGRAILIGKGSAHLRRSIRFVSSTDHSVTIGSDIPYAKIHNDGFNGTETVRAHTRKRFTANKEPRGVTKKGKPRMQSVLKPIGDIEVKSFTRHMNMPQRRYMGESKALRKNVRELITDEVNTCFK